MAFFNFDCISNVTSCRTPSIKVINKRLYGEKGVAGFWISDESLKLCKWIKACNTICEEDCTNHYCNLLPHIIIDKNSEEISGKGIINPRFCVIRRSKLIRLSNKGSYEGLWVKGDGEKMDADKNRKYKCARRYLLLFMDKNNKPLHEDYIQLTAKGTFMVDFDNNYIQFRNDIRNAYCKVMRRKIGIFNEQWYAMCVFEPIMKSRIVGSNNLKSEACYVESYNIPTENNWELMCVGRIQEVNEIVSILFSESQKWIDRFSKNVVNNEIIDNISEDTNSN